MDKRIQTYEEFWVFYLNAHSNRWNRLAHILATLAATIWVIFCLLTSRFSWALLGPVGAYAFAWFFHLVVEKNRPATWKYPLWSFISDFRMGYLFLRGKL